MKSSLPVFVSFLGWSDTGKTMLVCACLEFLAKKGVRTTAVKRAYHELKIDKKESDSARMMRSGARNVMVLGMEGSVIFSNDYDREHVCGRDDLVRIFPETEVFLLEGFVPGESGKADGVNGNFSEAVLKVLCAGSANSVDELKYPLSKIDVLVTQNTELTEDVVSLGKPVVKSDQPERLIEFMEERYGLRS